MPDLLIRSLRPGDTDAIVNLYDAASARDTNIGPITAAQWTDFVQRPHNQGGQDFRVAVQDNQLIGLAESSLRDQDGRQVRFFKLVIDPSRRRQGVGTALLKELLALNAPDSAVSFQTLAASDWPDGLAFLERLGFLHIESEITMRCSSLSAQAPALSDGIVVERSATPLYLATDVARLHNAAFASDVAFRSYSVAEMEQILAEKGQVLWVVRDRYRILGYCRMECEPGLIWLEQIAIDPNHQSRGLGMALAYGALQAAGVDRGRPAGLNVSSVNGTARSMYQKLGFAIRREVRRYSLSQLDLIGRMAIAR
ncbi:GNAT family N-acetyltransferase [Rhizobium sp. NPDC090279]|uniref:GNAT family N-acetyltransferase n=1 Tax=Rhizobium sp. NPDC090279 TaxID=3364499 RepID=UPI00383AB837